MRIKRYKKTQRYLGFFEKQFKFRRPFQILVDGTFTQAALVNKVNIREQLPKYLDGPVKLLTTPCLIIETESIGREVYGGLQVLKQFPTHKCSHLDEPKPATACVLSMVKPDNPNRYIIATQDNGLRERLRRVPGVPLIYLHGNAPTMEKPSEKSVAFAEKKNLERVEVLEYQKEILNVIKKAELPEEPQRKGTKRKKKGGPNPLSCKKSKKQKVKLPSSISAPELPSAKKKRKRIRYKRVPNHVRLSNVLNSEQVTQKINDSS